MFVFYFIIGRMLHVLFFFHSKMSANAREGSESETESFENLK